MMPQMMMGQKDTGKLVDRLLKSFAAMEAEKDPAALGDGLSAQSTVPCSRNYKRRFKPGLT